MRTSTEPACSPDLGPALTTPSSEVARSVLATTWCTSGRSPTTRRSRGRSARASSPSTVGGARRTRSTRSSHAATACSRGRRRRGIPSSSGSSTTSSTSSSSSRCSRSSVTRPRSSSSRGTPIWGRWRPRRRSGSGRRAGRLDARSVARRAWRGVCAGDVEPRRAQAAALGRRGAPPAAAASCAKAARAPRAAAGAPRRDAADPQEEAVFLGDTWFLFLWELARDGLVAPELGLPVGTTTPSPPCRSS